MGNIPEINPLPSSTSPVSAVPLDAPPHPLDAEWHVHINGQTYGPYTGHRLGEFVKEGRIDKSTQVLEVGSEAWSLAGQDLRLASLFNRAPPQAPPISAAAGSTVVQITNQMAPTAVLLDDTGVFGAKSPGVALFLSFLLCGAGQMYCGRVGKGILMLIGCIALWFIFLGWTVWIWSMIDAYATAKDMNLRYLRRLQSGQPV
ncbi:GYF domain-containing protein [Bradyrhizobium sp. SZCCHNRI20481]|uniref:GYF domain-containing protein n=1 Tax=Bradyrhizobium sp. SZCCHNRI20481 TaxID=3057286 RepID=UPI0029166900|nr:GYF domain-containing protein [Bradyrhizobium sp. SZCCHNRI20481]